MKTEEMTVGQIMTTEPATLRRDDTLDLAEDIMTLGRIRHLIVVDQGRVAGVISERDLFRSALSSVLHQGYDEHKGLLKTVLVRDVMSAPVYTIGPDALVREAARMMLDRRIGCLPVVQGDQLSGIVTESDLIRLLT